ncbi:hypothetical protein OKW96_16105 [Sphingobacterium sp. KU25419]|nr:hypothetical protein OKW96_16105 [Sphingobacterium sp. KU25419]
MVADDPDCKINLKSFHSSVQNNHAILQTEIAGYKSIPIFRQIDVAIVQKNYLQIKQEVRDIMDTEIGRIQMIRQ